MGGPNEAPRVGRQLGLRGIMKVFVLRHQRMARGGFGEKDGHLEVICSDTPQPPGYGQLNLEQRTYASPTLHY